MKIRRLSQSDLTEVCRIQRECYHPEILESAASFAAKLSAAPEFCFMAEQDDRALGYAVALPWLFGEIVALDGLEYSSPPQADSLCLHDVAVSPEARKTGTARQLLGAVMEAAAQSGYNRVFLVAIPGASSYWQRHGFEVVPVDEPVMRHLSHYGEGSTYMARAVGE